MAARKKATKKAVRRSNAKVEEESDALPSMLTPSRVKRALGALEVSWEDFTAAYTEVGRARTQKELTPEQTAACERFLEHQNRKKLCDEMGGCSESVANGRLVKFLMSREVSS